MLGFSSVASRRNCAPDCRGGIAAKLLHGPLLVAAAAMRSTIDLGSWRCDETYIRVKGRWTLSVPCCR
jgi:hypothetical protein